MTWVVSDIKLKKFEWFSTVDKGASGNEKHRTKIVLWKRAAQPTEIQKMTLEEILAKMPEEEKSAILAAIAAAKGPVTPVAPVAPVDPMMPPVPVPVVAADPTGPADPEKTDVAKVEDKEIEKRFKNLEAEKIELAKRVNTLTEEATTIRLEKRAKEFDFLPIEKLELVKVLGSVEKSLDDGQQKTFNEMLVRINKAMKASPLFDQHGADGDGKVETAIEKRDKAVAELIKTEPKHTLHTARKEIYKRDTALYDEVNAELA